MQKFWGDLYEKGWLYKSAYEGHAHEETSARASEDEFVCPDCALPRRPGEFLVLQALRVPDKLLAFYDEDVQA